MGQAKARGSREDRVQQAIVRNMEAAKRRIRGMEVAQRNISELAAALWAADPSQVQEDGARLILGIDHGSPEGDHSVVTVRSGDRIVETVIDPTPAELSKTQVTALAQGGTGL